MFVTGHGSELLRLWRVIQEFAGPLVHIDPHSAAVGTAVALVKEVVYSSNPSVFEASSLLYALSLQLADSLVRPGAAAPPGIQRRSLDVALDYCRMHVSEPITVDDIARAAGYSRYHFTRLFTASQGVSPKEYLQDMRIRKAMELLQTTRSTIKEVAAQCGFVDVNYFCRAFKRNAGISPGEFRTSGMFQSNQMA